MGTPFWIALLQIKLCKKGSNFVAGGLRVPLQFVWPDARFEQRHWFCAAGFRRRSSPRAADHIARGGDHCERRDIRKTTVQRPDWLFAKTVGPGWRARKPRSRRSAARLRPSSRNRPRRRQEAQSGSKRLTSAGLSARLNAMGGRGTSNALPRGTDA